jgi:hypothetical protein
MASRELPALLQAGITWRLEAFEVTTTLNDEAS